MLQSCPHRLPACPSIPGSLQGEHHGGRQGQRKASTPWTCQQQDSSSSESESDWDDWEVLEAVLGRPRTAAERRKFGRVWREWQRASAATRGGTANGTSGSASSSSSSSGGGSSGGSSWAGMWSDDEEGWSGASSRGASSYSAGNSAGPRWGKASWTWEDMHSEYGSRSGSASADYETWYTPPPGGGSSGRRRAAAGGSRSAGDAWGSHTSWQWSAGGGWHAGSWQSSSWQHEGWHGSSSSSSSGGSNNASGSMAGHLRLLGLESSWLSTRCGKALRCAFLAKAKAEHPDMHAAAGSGAAAAAKERFQRVTEAYEVLLAMVRP